MMSAEGARPPQRIDTQTAHPARRYNYWLGGKDHFAADRESGDAIEAYFPTVRIAALENRAFMRRAVTFLAKEAGVRQFLDIGTGIPAPNNTHEIAQAIAPESRVVYVDNDPIVLSHARALLNSSPEGATAYVEADLRDHERILSDPYLRGTLDFSQPIALLLIAILHFLKPEDDPYQVVGQLARALPAGSYLIATHATADFAPPERVAADPPSSAFQTRSKEEIEPFFEGMDMVPPGIVATVNWRAEDEPEPRPTPREIAMYGAVGRIP
jgi:SAM-dependent methyltransferase